MAIKCAYNASRGMIDLLTEAGLEPALLLLLTERLPINGPGHIYLKPTSFLIAISSIGSWMMLPIPIPFIMPNRLTGAPYLALGNYAIHAYLICLTHVPYIMMAVPQTPLSCFVTPIWTMSGLSDFSTIIFTFSIIPYLILFVKRNFNYFQRIYVQSVYRTVYQITIRQ